MSLSEYWRLWEKIVDFNSVQRVYPKKRAVLTPEVGEKIILGQTPMSKTIEIVDRGRGPQLSTSRITVQDVVPCLQRNCTPEEIMELMPVLTVEDIRVIEQYVRDNYEAVMEQDRRIRERTANRVTPPEILAIREKGRIQRLALIEQFAKIKAQEKNGDAPRG